MKNYSFILGLIFFAGCVSFGPESEHPRPSELVQRKILVDVARAKVGMTVEEVVAVLGKDVVVGYQKDAVGAFEPVTIQNPYRDESVTNGRSSYRVIYFIYSIVNPDGIISDEELMPIIFQNGKLFAKGWDALFKLKHS